MSFDWIRGKDPTKEGIMILCLPEQPDCALLGSNCIPSFKGYGTWEFWKWEGVRNTSADAIWVGDDNDNPEDEWYWDIHDPHIIRVWDRHEGLPLTSTTRIDSEKFVKEWLENHDHVDARGMDNWVSFRRYNDAKWFVRYSEMKGFFCLFRGQGRIKEKDEEGNLISLFGGGIFCSLISWEYIQELGGKCGAYSVGRKFFFDTDRGALDFLNTIEEWGMNWSYDSKTKVATIH